jgi:hypothetical protein
MTIYRIAEAAPLVGISTARLLGWARHPDGPCSRDAHPSVGLLSIGFRGLLEAAVASALVAQRLTASELRTVVRAARDVFQDCHPLATAKFLDEGEELVDAVLPGRTLGRRFIRPAGFGAVDHDGNGAPVRWWPRGRRGGLLVDPLQCSGRLVDAASFVPVHLLAIAAETEGSVEKAAACWQVDVASVRNAVRHRALAGRI